MNLNMEEKSNYNRHDLITNKEYFNELDEILTCHICHGFQIDPIKCSICQNSFCSECLQTWDKNRLGNFSCIFKCKDNDFIKNCKLIKKNLEILVIKCYRCSTEVKYAELTNHVNRTCGKKKVACRNQGCGKLINRDSIEAHNADCEYMMINCEEFGYKILRKDQNRKISSIKRELAYEYVSEMFSLIDKDLHQSSHLSILDLIYQKIEKTGMFLDSDQMKIIFDKLLEFHSEKIDNNYEESLRIILNSMLKNHIELFKKYKNLSDELLNKFLYAYSLDHISDAVLPKVLHFLCDIIYHLCEYIPWNSDNISLIVKTNIKCLEHNNPEARHTSSRILGNMAVKCSEEFNVHLVKILNSIVKALNYKEDGKNREQFELKYARDWAIWSIGNIIRYRHEHLNSSEWISKWLSYFPLESCITQEYSYKILCLFNQDKPEILYGVNNENLPSIIKILIKVYKDDNFKLIIEDSQNRINSFFEKIKDNPTLIQYVKIAKANSQGRILEKLNKYFP